MQKITTKAIIFHPALAPYRVDFFNALADSFDARFYFSNDNLIDQKFDQQQLRSQCRFEFRLLNKGFEIGGRSFRTGIFNLLKNHNPGIVICSEYSQITLVVLILKFLFRFKFQIYTISDDSTDLSAKRSGLRKWIRDVMSHFIDGIIFPSESVCDWYHKHVNGTTRLFALPIVHDNHAFRLKLEEAIPEANSNLLNYRLHGKVIFIFVGRLIKIKNVSFLINSFAKVSSRMPDAILVIIGEGAELNSLHNLIRERGLELKCLILGRLEGLPLYAWFNMAQCLVLPSYQEPYGAVVNEALLSGCNVLCSKMAGASELITSSNGSVFDPFDLDELGRLFLKYYSDISPIYQRIELKSDLMPFQLSDKLISLVSFLKV